MKLAYFDCFSGISGDMTLGALLDAGCDLVRLREELRGLQVPGWELAAEKVWKNGMAATCARVKTEDKQRHRPLSAILQILRDSKLASPVRDRASAIFQKLGEATMCPSRKSIFTKLVRWTLSWTLSARASASTRWASRSLHVRR
jgi:uncharacterized protein (DUF111 family)